MKLKKMRFTVVMDRAIEKKYNIYPGGHYVLNGKI